MKSPFYRTGVSKTPLNHYNEGISHPEHENLSSKSSFTPPDLSLTDTKPPSKVSMANSGAKTGTTDFANVKSRKSSDTKITAGGLLEAASYAPVIGTAAQVAIAGKELSQGNYKNAAMAGFFAIPGTKLLKGAGKLIKAGMKAFSKPSKNVIKETAKMTSKNHPNYFKPGRTFSDLKGDGSLRVNPKEPTISTRKDAVDNWTTNTTNAQNQLTEQSDRIAQSKAFNTRINKVNLKTNQPINTPSKTNTQYDVRITDAYGNKFDPTQRQTFNVNSKGNLSSLGKRRNDDITQSLKGKSKGDAKLKSTLPKNKIKKLQNPKTSTGKKIKNVAIGGLATYGAFEAAKKIMGPKNKTSNSTSTRINPLYPHLKDK